MLDRSHFPFLISGLSRATTAQRSDSFARSGNEIGDMNGYVRTFSLGLMDSANSRRLAGSRELSP
jgi:hypothetical protein